MKRLLTILFLFAFTHSFGQMINNNQRIFNVKMFGAKGDGVTNDGPAFIAAVNAANAAGGGKVWAPRGIYVDSDTLDAGCNCQIPIAAVNGLSTARNHITIEGEVAPNFIPTGGGPVGGAGSTITTGMVVIKSSRTTGVAGSSVIGTALAGSFYNETFLSVKNIAFQMKNNPSGGGPAIGGISYKNGGGVPDVENVVVYIDTSVYRSVMPTNDVVGIETPDNSSETFNGLKNTLVVGFRTGYKIGEHVLLEQVQAMGCYYGFNIKAGYHSMSAARIGTFWCAYDIYVSGFCTLANFQLDAEWLSQGKWFDDVATIKDTANLANGQLFYTIIQGFVGKNNAKFVKTGGANLHTLSNDEGIASANNPIPLGTSIGSATNNGILFYLNGLRQTSTKLNFDSANTRVGIGKATPASILDLSTAGGNDPINITNTNTASAASYNATNDLGDIIGLRAYGSTNGNSGFPRNGVLFATNNLLIGSDAGVSSGGNHAIKFMTQGAATAQVKATLFSTGTFSINTTSDSTSAKLIVKNSILSDSLTGQTGSAGNLFLSSTTNATKGKLLLGSNSAYNENTKMLGVGTAAPTLGFVQADGVSPAFTINNTDATGVSRVRFYEGGSNIGDFQFVGSTNATTAERNWMEFVNRTATGGISFYTNSTLRVAVSAAGVTSLFKGSTVSSAAAIVPTGNVFHVSGTTSITSITATNITAGATITIIFDGVLTFTDGSNLKLAGNFTTAADATITLVYDGTNFYETARSTN